MPRYDPDVIAALAEGRLDPDEAARLENEIANDPVAAAELADHRAALAFLASAPAATMTEAERTELRAAVADAIGITEPETTADSAGPRRVPWASLGIAAAALAGLVAVVPVVGLLSTGGDDAGDSLELAAEAATTTTEAVEETLRLTLDDPAEPPAALEESDGLTAGADATPEASTFGSSTTRATTTTSAATAAAPTTTAPPATTTTTTDEDTSTAESSAPEGVDQLVSELETLRSDPDAVAAYDPQPADPEATCWVEDTDVRTDPPPSRLVFQYQNDDLTVIVYFEERGDGELGPFQVWGVPDCAKLVVVGEE